MRKRQERRKGGTLDGTDFALDEFAEYARELAYALKTMPNRSLDPDASPAAPARRPLGAG